MKLIQLFKATCALNIIFSFSVLFAETNHTQLAWPLMKGEGKIVLRPGIIQNPVSGGTIMNGAYFISGEFDENVFSPCDGTVRWIGKYELIFPDAINMISFDSIEEFKGTSKN